MTPRRRFARPPLTRRWGVLFALAAAGISGVSIWVNAFAVRQLPDPAVYTTLKNAIAAIVLIALAAAVTRPAQLRAVPAGSWARLALIGVIGGSVPFLLFFGGLAQATAPSAAFIQKTLFVWVALLAVPVLGERLGAAQLVALGVLLAGQALILTPAGVTWGPGETMIAAATAMWAVETIIARRVLATVPSIVAGSARLAFGLPVLLGYLAITGGLAGIPALQPAQWAWVLLTGILLGAYVVSWFAALKRAPASLVTAILVLGAPITAALQTLQSGHLPGGPVLAGQVLVLVAGAGLIAVDGRRRRFAEALVHPA
jgi:drug/metabolite transporter (DMT)-like permease